MSDSKLMIEQMSSLDDYSLMLAYKCSLSLINKRGLFADVIGKPSELKKFKGGPTSSRDQKFSSLSNSFDELISQDWSYLFEGDYDNNERYYVYAHCDPRKKDNCIISEFKSIGLPFYIGKGTGDRCVSKTRNKPHRELIRSIEGYGFQMTDIARIYKDGMNERDALIPASCDCLSWCGTRTS